MYYRYIWSSMTVLMVGTNDEHMTPHTLNEKIMYRPIHSLTPMQLRASYQIGEIPVI